MSEITIQSIAMNTALSHEEATFLWDVKAELERLRGIEAAAMNGQSRAVAVEHFRAVAREFVLRRDRVPLFAIADALEVKP